VRLFLSSRKLDEVGIAVDPVALRAPGDSDLQLYRFTADVQSISTPALERTFRRGAQFAKL